VRVLRCGGFPLTIMSTKESVVGWMQKRGRVDAVLHQALEDRLPATRDNEDAEKLPNVEKRTQHLSILLCFILNLLPRNMLKVVNFVAQSRKGPSVEILGQPLLRACGCIRPPSCHPGHHSHTRSLHHREWNTRSSCGPMTLRCYSVVQ
jgi:hypothetical protein